MSKKAGTNKNSKNSKNIRCRCLGLLLVSLIFMGCGQKPESVIQPLPTTVPMITEPENAGEKKGYLFFCNGMEIAMDMKAAPVLETLGTSQSYFEAESCAVDGTIRTYGYGSFELDTYEINKEEYISGIYFKDDTITTAEGAYLFMTKEQLFEIYGSDYSTEVGMLVYSKDGMKLKFILTDDLVTCIQYASLATEVKQ